MPRTKVAKNSKRNREQAQEELWQNTVREFDYEVELKIAELELEHTNNLREIEEEFQRINSMIPENILNMKLGDLKAMGVKTFAMVTQILNSNETETINTTCEQKSHYNRKESKGDEGYLTEGPSEPSVGGSAIRGPLSAARAQMRRSKSAGILQSIPRVPPSRLKPPTPLKGPQTEHKSRSAYRTPLPQPKRIKAASADRIDKIQPKMPIDESLALLRFPRAGETLVSLTGSPVVGCPGNMESRASVNIPTNDGVLSLRPTASTNFDANMLSQIDDETFRNLQQLHKNLATIMELSKKQQK